MSSGTLVLVRSILAQVAATCSVVTLHVSCDYVLYSAIAQSVLLHVTTQAESDHWGSALPNSSTPFVEPKNPARPVDLSSVSESETHDLGSHLISRRTLPGGRVSSCSVDPFMAPGQEEEIWSILQRKSCRDWSGLTLESLAQTVNKECPTWLDVSDLENVGISPTTLLPDVGKMPSGALAVQLISLLRPLDLTIEVRAARLEIVCSDNWQDRGSPLRFYDVTPIVRKPSRLGLNDLILTIEQSIQPDSWISAGGNGCIQATVLFDGHSHIGLLLIATNTVSHLQIQALLDRLNQLSGFEANHSGNYEHRTGLSGDSFHGRHSDLDGDVSQGSRLMRRWDERILPNWNF